MTKKKQQKKQKKQKKEDTKENDNVEYITWNQIEQWIWKISKKLKNENFRWIHGAPRGGLVPAVWLSHAMNIPYKYTSPLERPYTHTLIVEDVIDTGESIDKFKEIRHLVKIVSLVRKPWSPKVHFTPHKTDKWVIFPWETV